MKNPFYPVAEFPDFPAMTPDAADEALPRLLADAKAAVDALEERATPTWDGFVRALDAGTRPLWTAWRCVKHLLSVANSEPWRKLQEKYQQDIVAFGLRVDQSKRFYELAKATPAETPARKRILEKMVLCAELAGVALPPEKQARFNAIQAELAKLSNEFSNSVIDATKAFKIVLTNPAEVEGLPAQLKAMLAGDGDPAKGPWTVTIEDAVYMPFMKHSRNRPVREALLRARATRAPENEARIDRILALRKELASLIGFASFADLSLAEKCAPSVAAVDKMIADLAEASKPGAAREEAELAAFAAAEGFAGKLQPWDRAFWAERQREKKYDYSEEELSRYFNLPVVLNGLFKFAERLFGVSIEPADWTAPVWHKDVRFFRVYDESRTLVAHFYFDPYSRPATKSGGAWVYGLRSRELRPDGTVEKPLAVICCNQALPDAQGRALMRFSEVETLFHEFGHAIQHMLTKVDDVGASGINLIEWDAVEVASQFMENWCLDAKTLKSFARHAETNEAIPPELLARVRAAKNYRAANSSLRQLSFATVDMALHAGPQVLKDIKIIKDSKDIKDLKPDEIKKLVFDAMSPGVTIPEDRFLNAFTHIFKGGYAAGYYGYKWSEVMSADVFGAFEEAGLDDEAAVRRLGQKYRDTFLALGGSVDPMEVFARFRGRAPTIDALLRQTGLKEAR